MQDGLKNNFCLCKSYKLTYNTPNSELQIWQQPAGYNTQTAEYNANDICHTYAAKPCAKYHEYMNMGNLARPN
jgi:hypothetical protein